MFSLRDRHFLVISHIAATTPSTLLELIRSLFLHQTNQIYPVDLPSLRRRCCGWPSGSDCTVCVLLFFHCSRDPDSGGCLNDRLAAFAFCASCRLGVYVLRAVKSLWISRSVFLWAHDEGLQISMISVCVLQAVVIPSMRISSLRMCLGSHGTRSFTAETENLRRSVRSTATITLMTRTCTLSDVIETIIWRCAILSRRE
jgi:hypothetical protein